MTNEKLLSLFKDGVDEYNQQTDELKKRFEIEFRQEPSKNDLKEIIILLLERENSVMKNFCRTTSIKSWAFSAIDNFLSKNSVVALLGGSFAGKIKKVISKYQPKVRTWKDEFIAQNEVFKNKVDFFF